MEDSGFAVIIKNLPQAPYKYLGRHLSYSLGLRARCAALIHHYAFMCSFFEGKLASTLAIHDMTLCAWGSDEQVAIQLKVASLTMFEGELVLNYLFNNACIFFITFSVVPGYLFGISDKNIVFIGGSQGSKNNFDLIQTATKNNYDVSPQATLVTCIKAITASMGILKIVGISVNNQVAIGRNMGAQIYRGSYDELWLASGGVQISCGDFLIPANLHEKPINMIKKGHRIRTRKKRNFKHFIYNQTLLSLENPSSYQYAHVRNNHTNHEIYNLSVLNKYKY